MAGRSAAHSENSQIRRQKTVLRCKSDQSKKSVGRRIVKPDGPTSCLRRPPLQALSPLIFAPSTLTGNIQIFRVNSAELLACPKNQHRDF